MYIDDIELQMLIIDWSVCLASSYLFSIMRDDFRITNAIFYSTIKWFSIKQIRW